MQIVIDIPNSLYANLQKIQNGSIASKRLLDCVRNGTPLPKGHGRLIDADEFQMKCFRRNFSNQIDDHEMADINMLLHLSPTIIPAEEVQE